MRQSFRDAFVRIMAEWEGVVPWMYLDILSLVTVGIGNLIDPIDLAMDLPFVRPDGSAATKAEIRAAWLAVKRAPHLAKQGHVPAQRYTTIRLTPQGVHDVVLRRFDVNHAILKQRFPDIESWPADAILATHSVSWACGANFHFPRLASALRARDFDAAAIHCHINEDGADRVPGTADDNRGLKPRNAGNKRMYRNAAKVQAWKLSPDDLYFPEELVEVPTTAEPVPPTLRPEDLEAARITGTSEAMREVFDEPRKVEWNDPPVVIVDDREEKA